MEHLYRLVGLHGQGRIEAFARTAPGWDGPGKGLALKEQSVVLANEYAQSLVDCSYRDKLCVFMTHEGHLVLDWLDKDDLCISLEFAPGGVGVFVEKTGAEFVAPMGDPRIPEPD